MDGVERLRRLYFASAVPLLGLSEVGPSHFDHLILYKLITRYASCLALRLELRAE